MEPNTRDVGRAEPTNGLEVFDGCLEGFDGTSLLGCGLVGGSVAGARGGGEEFEF